MGRNDNPLVSIIIPTYNVSQYIETCINSVINQSYKNIEIIPVDDGSIDGSGQILDRFSLTDNRIKVIHKENGGVSAARNTGMDIATGEYIVFVDGDDFLENDYVEYMLGMIKSGDADFAFSTDCFMFSKESQLPNQCTKAISSEDATSLLLGPRVVIGCWNKIYKKSFLEKYSLRFSTTQFFGEGLFFITTASQLANKIIVGNRKVYYYRRNNEGSACTKFNINNFYNGYKSLDLIEEHLIIRTPKVYGMLNWHRCQFKMAAVLRMQETNQVAKYIDYYDECLSYVRKHTLSCMLLSGVSAYRKLMLIATCVSPNLVAALQKKKRVYNEKHSVD